MKSIPARCRAFFSWWFAELSSFLPDRVLRLFRPPQQLLVLDVDDVTLSIRSVASGQEHEVGCLLISEINDPDRNPPISELVRDLLVDAGVVDPEVRVRVPVSKSLRRVLELPKAAQRDIRQALSFDMDRLTPFSSDDVYFDFRVGDQETASKRLRIELIVLPRGVVDAAVSLAEKAGLPPDAVDVDWSGDEHQQAWNFLPQTQVRPNAHRQTVLSWALATLTLLLAATAVYVPMHRDRTVLAQLESEVAASKQQAELGRKLQEEFQHVSEQARFIFDNRLARPTVIDVIDELTRTLPDDTWLFRLRYTNGEVQAFGNSSAASALIGLVEGSPMFSDARFLAPITRDRQSDIERFQIGFQIVQADKP
ncbi:MAG: pilus assembly protein PilM [Hyphomicrobiales bacterium]|nr:pilus assembly protein PilM [Hyphomicrobiales bacterium]